MKKGKQEEQAIEVITDLVMLVLVFLMACGLAGLFPPVLTVREIGEIVLVGCVIVQSWRLSKG